ncbi:MAG: hypothetical protein ABIP39_00910 [Polyangiaceae bacterium]
MQNRVFFPQQALDQWMADDTVDLVGTELTIKTELRRYHIAEAVRITQEVAGEPDANDLVGRVKSKVYLQALGAELLETSMLIGDNAYDVVPGWLGAPVGSFDEHVAAVRASADFAPEEVRTDEDLLARFLLKSLK